MRTALIAFVVIALVDPPKGKEPPTKKELAAITDRGRDLAGYDAAAWHASDAVQAKQPKEGSVVRYIARMIDKKWVVAFGRLDEKQGKFLITYEATQGDKPDVFDVKEMTPPKEDTGFFLSAARAIDTSLKDFMEHFEGEQRPYNVAVLPAEKGQALGLSRSRTYQAERISVGWGCPLPDLTGWDQGHREKAVAQGSDRERAAQARRQPAGGGHPHARSLRNPRRHGRVPCPDEKAQGA